MPDREKQRRKQAIARYLADDKIEDICKVIGGSKSWLYKWRDRYQADDHTGPKSSREGCDRAIPKSHIA